MERIVGAASLERVIAVDCEAARGNMKRDGVKIGILCWEQIDV